MTKSITTRSGLELSILTAMRYCQRNDFKDEQAREDQRYVAYQLYQKFDSGDDDVNCNPALAKTFQMKFTGAAPLLSPTFDAETIAYLMGFYTTVRLFLVRLARVLQLSFIAYAFLPRFFGFFGFSYFLEYLFLLGTNCYEAYQALKANNRRKEGETEWMAFKRCYMNALAINPKRKYRMDNALRWGPINLISTFLGPIAFAVVNIWGFFRDVVNEAVNSPLGSDIENDRLIMNMSIQRMDELKTEQTRLGNEISQLANQGDSEALTQKQTRLNLITTHLTTLQNQTKQIENELPPQYKKQGTEMFFVLLILAGVVLYATPGLNVIAFAVGACCVLTASTYYMYNRYNKVKKFVSDPQRKNETHDLQADDVSEEEISKVVNQNMSGYLETIEGESTPSPLPFDSTEVEPTPSPKPISDSPKPIGEEAVFKFLPSLSPSPSQSTISSNSSSVGLSEISATQQAAILNIFFLYHVFCQVVKANDADIDVIFLGFSVNEINKMRLLLDFHSSNDWSQQWSIWRKNKNTTGITKTASTTLRTRTHYYDCSLKQTLFNKIQEENDSHKASESDESVKKIIAHLNTKIAAPA